jgi:hypothetical protein
LGVRNERNIKAKDVIARTENRRGDALFSAAIRALPPGPNIVLPIPLSEDAGQLK